ncbi:MAG: metallophosphoesterase [Haloferacaceae archaeon]
MATRLGVIADVHGNLIALGAVLSDMPPVDGLVCAGDVVGYNPWPAACVAAMRGRADRIGGGGGVIDGVEVPADAVPNRAVPTVMGNHDRAVAAGTAFRFNAMAKAGVEYARERLDGGALSWLEGLPDRRTVADGRVRIVHGHPDDPDRYTYPAEFSAGMLDGEDVLVTGHTHVQGDRRFDEGIVMNPGSVGQPRDGDPRAGYAVIELGDDGGVSLDQRRVGYDVDRVVEAVRAADLPERIGTRLYEGR